MKHILVATWATGLCCAGALAAEPPLWQQPNYTEAIMKARAGDPTPALGLLEPLRKLGPLPAPLFDDYLTLLVWAGQGAQALHLLPGHEAELTEDTLHRLARAARDLQDKAEAVRLYQRLVSLHPSTLGYRAGLAMAQAESGQTAAAAAALQAVVPDAESEEREWFRARAYVALQADDPFLALDVLQKAREQWVDDAEINRLYLVTLLRLQLPTEAQAALAAMPDVDPALAWQIESDRAAVLSRWGRIEERQTDGAQRFSQTDAALALNAAMASHPLTLDPVRAQRHDDDRLQMLQLRGDADEVVALGQRRPDVDWSPYAQAALADAYLTLRQPDRAVALYRLALNAIAQDRRPLDWREGLVYALLESGQYDACRAELSALRRDVPRTVRDAAGRLKFNSHFQRVELLQAMVNAFMEDPRSAWNALEDMRRAAPAHAHLRSSMGAVALMRGWPRQARDIYTRLWVDDPESVEAHTGLAAVALDLNDAGGARQQLDWLQQRKVQSSATRSLQERVLWAQRPQLVWDVARESGNDQGAGTAYAWDSTLRGYSGGWGHWRLLALQVRQQADYVGLSPVARFDQWGLGLQYRTEHASAEIGLTVQTVPQARPGAFASWEWTPDDHWAIGLRSDSDSADLPLKGRLNNTQGHGWQTTVSHRWDEGRRVGAQWSALTLSDGNRRRSWSGHWDERWLSGPRYQLSTQVGVATSRNDQTPAAVYFNPGRDASWWLSTKHEWPLVTTHDSRWVLRAEAAVGAYWQQGYGRAPVRTFALEAAWRGPRGREWRVGWSRTRHPYDGVIDTASKLMVHWEQRW